LVIAAKSSPMLAFWALIQVKEALQEADLPAAHGRTAIFDGRRPLKMAIGRIHTSCRPRSEKSRRDLFRACSICAGAKVVPGCGSMGVGALGWTERVPFVPPLAACFDSASIGEEEHRMKGYRLYWARNTGAMAPHVLLAVSGAPYALQPVDLESGEHRSAAYLQINPYGQVPALQLPDGSFMTESAAMMLHIAECFPETGLLPAAGSATRAQVQRWLIFLATNVYESALRYYYSDRFTTDPVGGDAVRAAADAALTRQWGLIDSLLQPGPYLLGRQRSIFDLYMLMLSGWTDHTKALTNVQRAIAALLADARIREVWTQHTAE
jgi:glutathione S-transferase